MVAHLSKESICVFEESLRVKMISEKSSGILNGGTTVQRTGGSLIELPQAGYNCVQLQKAAGGKI